MNAHSQKITQEPERALIRPNNFDWSECELVLQWPLPNELTQRKEESASKNGKESWQKGQPLQMNPNFLCLFSLSIGFVKLQHWSCKRKYSTIFVCVCQLNANWKPISKPKSARFYALCIRLCAGCATHSVNNISSDSTCCTFMVWCRKMVLSASIRFTL